ncbi:MAGUK p55 subfamily member 7 [Tachysurus ichikawai]
MTCEWFWSSFHTLTEIRQSVGGDDGSGPSSGLRVNFLKLWIVFCQHGVKSKTLFIEYGEHGGNYYGTSLDAVRKVLAESKVCLLDVEPNAVKLLYTTEFKPYVTFVKPPAIEQLRLSRRKAKILASCDEAKPTRTFMEADFKEMINTAQDMEDNYGYLFEKIIINADLAAVFTELRAELKKLEKESNWIPKIWA